MLMLMLMFYCQYSKVFDFFDDYVHMKNKGFTLVELLVSVAIIGIIASMSISMFEEYRRKALRAELYHMAHNIKSAAEVFLIDSASRATPGFFNFNVFNGSLMELTEQGSSYGLTLDQVLPGFSLPSSKNFAITGDLFSPGYNPNGRPVYTGGRYQISIFHCKIKYENYDWGFDLGFPISGYETIIVEPAASTLRIDIIDNGDCDSL